MKLSSLACRLLLASALLHPLLASTRPAITGSAPLSRPYSLLMPPLDPATLRRHYEAASTDKAAGEKFYQLLADYQAQLTKAGLDLDWPDDIAKTVR